MTGDVLVMLLASVLTTHYIPLLLTNKMLSYTFIYAVIYMKSISITIYTYYPTKQLHGMII